MQSHWREYALGGFALLVEALALLFGISALTVGAAILFWLAIWDHRLPQLRGKPLKSRFALGLGIAILVLTVTSVIPIAIKNWIEKRHYKPEQAKSEKKELPPEPPLTLESLFGSDFPNLMKFTITGELAFENGETVKIKSQEYADFLSKSSFIGFYIPDTPLTFRSCIRIGNSIPETFKKIENSLSVDTSFDAGETRTSLRGLSFSGRVFIYHAQPLTLKQMSTALDYFKSKHLDVQFRGMRYLQDEELRRRLRKPEARFDYKPEFVYAHLLE